MKPKIKYSLSRQRTIKVRIKIYNLPPGVYDTGITVNPEEFDKEKQICGDPQVMKFMIDTKAKLIDLYRPSLDAAGLWSDYNATLKKDQPHTIRDAFKYYLSSIHLAAKSKVLYQDSMNHVEKAGILDINLKDVTPQMVKAFLNGLSLAESTKYLVYSHFKTVISRYVRDNALIFNVRLNGIMKSPSVKHDVIGEEEYLSVEELTKLQNAEIPDDEKGQGKGRKDHHKAKLLARDFFILMCYTGLSVSDLKKFSWDHVSNDEKWIEYRRKKNGQPAMLPLLPEAKKIMRKYPLPMRMEIRTLQHHCQNLITKMVGRRVTCHTARHSYATLMLTLGFSIESTSKMLGHSNSLITSQVYAKVTQDKMDLELENLSPKSKVLLGY